MTAPDGGTIHRASTTNHPLFIVPGMCGARVD
jgi:hypothetical protein